MSTSATDSAAFARKHTATYLIVTLFCALFGYVYERFSHEVYSPFMMYMFVIPLVLGLVPNAAIWLSQAPFPKKAADDLYNCGVSALTVGSCVTGVFEIYGTTSPYTKVYWIVGAALTLAGAVIYLCCAAGAVKGGR